VWKLTPLLTSSDLRALTAARKLSAVSGTTNRFSPFIWAVRSLGDRDRNHARKPRVSVTPVMNTGVLFLRWPAGTGAAGAEVVPAGVPLTGPDMSCDMRLLAASEEAAESDVSDSVVVGLSGPLYERAARPAATATYAGLCGSWLLWSTSLSVAEAHELLPEASSGAGRRVAGSPEEFKFRWLAFLLMSCRRVGALAEPPVLPKATAVFSLLAAKAFLSSRSRAGNCLAAEIAFKKSRSYWLTVDHTISRGRNSLEHSRLILYYFTPLKPSIQREYVLSLHFTLMPNHQFYPCHRCYREHISTQDACVVTIPNQRRAQDVTKKRLMCIVMPKINLCIAIRALVSTTATAGAEGGRILVAQQQVFFLPTDVRISVPYIRCRW
jgi:hypothetical protein